MFARSEYSSSFENWGSTSESGLRFYTISKSLDKFSLSDVDDDKFYFVRLKTSVEFDSTQALKFRIPYVSVGDSLAWIGANKNDVTSYTDSSTKDLVFLGSDLKNGLDVSVKMYLFSETDLDFCLNGLVSIDVILISELDENPLDSYNSGYDAGYEDGQEFGYSDGYSNGYSDGQSSGFESGFESGVDSVDTDSYFMQGYEAGREVAYVEGFDEGYLMGYAEALTLDTSNKSSMIAGESESYVFNNHISLSDLTKYDFDLHYPASVFLRDFADESVNFEGYHSDGESSYFGELNLDCSYVAMGFCRDSILKMFTTSADVYGYSVKVKHYLGEYALKSSIRSVSFLVGDESDILNGSSFRTSVSDGSQQTSVFWLKNDNSVRDIFLSPLIEFTYSEQDFDSDSASIDVWYRVDIEVVPYTKEEYNASVSAIEKQTLELKKQTLEMEEQTEELKEQTETQKGMLSKMSEFFGGFFDNLKNAVIGLFVPSKEEMSSLFDRLMQFFNETFGFLFYPFDFIVRLVELFLTSANDDTSIVFPGFSIMGMQVWETMEIDLTAYEVTRELFGYVRMLTGAIIAFGFIDYLRKYFDKRFGGGGS